MSSFLGKLNLSRGIRNNNPGNLIYTSIAWQGKIPYSKNIDDGKKFEQFIDVKHGVRALILDVYNDIKKGKNTIRKLISEFAPPNENNTSNYVVVVSKAIGLKPDDVIKVVDFDLTYNIVKSIIKHENGNDAKYIVDSDILDAFDMIDITDLNGVPVRLKKRPKFNIIIIPLLLFFYTVLCVTV